MCRSNRPALREFVTETLVGYKNRSVSYSNHHLLNPLGILTIQWPLGISVARCLAEDGFSSGTGVVVLAGRRINGSVWVPVPMDFRWMIIFPHENDWHIAGDFWVSQTKPQRHSCHHHPATISLSVASTWWMLPATRGPNSPTSHLGLQDGSPAFNSLQGAPKGHPTTWPPIFS